MKTKNVTKEIFEKFFQDAMKIDKSWQCDYDEYTGKSYDYYVKIKPHLIIRNFDIETYPDCDKEFFEGQLEEAWNYFQDVGNFSRIIVGNGSIVADYYDKGVSQ